MKISRGVSIFLLLGMVSCGSADNLVETVSDGKPKDKKKNPEKVVSKVDPLSLTGNLHKAQNCGEVEEYIDDYMLKNLKARKDQEIKWVKSYHDRKVLVPAMAEAQESMASDSTSSDKSSPSEHTGTNNQVVGVEEADFVKSSGTHIFQIDNDQIQVVKAWPADEMKIIHAQKIEGRPYQMLLDEENKLLTVLVNPKVSGNEEVDKPMPDRVMLSDVPGGSYSQYDYNRTDIFVFSYSKDGKLNLEQDYQVEGSFVGVRRVGSKLRLVLRNHIEHYDLLYPSWYLWDRVKKKSEKIKSIEENYIKYQKKIKDRELHEWLGKKKEALAGGCGDVFLPSVPGTFGMTSVITVDLKENARNEMLLLGHSDEIYSSQDSLYLTSRYYNWWEGRTENFTYVHKFSSNVESELSYRGSGVVNGTPLNQFSMDEYQGALRIATTVGWNSESYNQVIVMKEVDGNLKVVGKTDKLAKGERIYSVRFHGPKGYVVTFRQVDPLFTLDLRDAKNPKVIGELKIPGFSNYMHMIDDDHILAIGQDGTNEGRILGLKISVFDVSDMKNPKEKFKKVFEGGYYSEASYDHKAFTYYASKGILAIPMTGHGLGWGSYRSSLFLFKVDINKGVSSMGEVAMNNIYEGQEIDWYGWYKWSRVERSFFADNIVYAVSRRGIRAAKLNELSESIATVRFE